MSKYFGILLFITTTLQMPIFYLTNQKLYICVYLVSMIYFLFLFLTHKQHHIFNKKNIYFLNYIALVFCCMLLSLFFLPAQSVLLGSMSYLFFQLFFFFYTNHLQMPGIIVIGKINTIICIISGMLAQYQVSIDPCLFGLYNGTNYEFFDIISEHRAASVFGSIQVYTAYMIFSIILFDAFIAKNDFKSKFIITSMFYFGLLSGSMAFITSFIIYYISKLAFSNKKQFIFFIIGIVLIWFILMLNIEWIISIESTPIGRILGQVFLGNNSGNNVRIQIWLETLNSNPLILFGNGVGSASSIVSGSERLSSESAFLTMYYEGGILLLLAFMQLLVNLFKIKSTDSNNKALSFAIVLVYYFTIVHVHDAVCLPILWLLIFGFITINQTKEHFSNFPIKNSYLMT